MKKSKDNNKDWNLTVLQEIFLHYCHDYCIKPLAEQGEKPNCEKCAENKVIKDISKIVWESEEGEDDED